MIHIEKSWSNLIKVDRFTHNQEYLAGNVYEEKEWKSNLFPISLDKAYDQSLDARDRHFHLIEKPFAHFVTDDGENECYRASSCLHW